MRTTKVKHPEGFECAVHLNEEELNRTICLMAALKMFELGKLSSGKAAELAGMPRVQFLETCGQYGVSVFNYSPEELEQEIKADIETLREAGS